MSKSILSRIVWGYGILILILILMVFSFIVSTTLDKLSSAQNLTIHPSNTSYTQVYLPPLSGSNQNT